MADVQGSVQLASHQTPVEPAATPPATAAASGAAPNELAPPANATQLPAAAPTATTQTVAASAKVSQAAELDWQEHLRAAITGLERETAEPPSSTSSIGRHAGLRMLQLVSGQRDAAMRPIVGIPATQQDFWSKELYGLSTMLDTERYPDEARRAAAAVVHLREANAKIGEIAALGVRNLAFCTEVNSFGVYKKFENYEFRPGQEVLLYAEVENLRNVPDEKGHHTALRSSYQIFDPRGARVDQKEFEVSEEHCQNPRRDYFIRYFVWMPKRIYDGQYTLQLTIEDTLSQKLGQASIDFTVKESAK